jgi:putative endonuclease
MSERLLKHNNRSYLGSFTRIANDWKIVLEFECVSRHQAIYLEKFIKKMKSSVFTQKIIANPEILNNIISKNNF